MSIILTDTFATKVEMDSNIKQAVDEVDVSVNKKLENYSTTTEMQGEINVASNQITAKVNEKVGKTEFGTYIQQNIEAVKVAWNQISEFIQMMIINNNASFAILDNKLAASQSDIGESSNLAQLAQTYDCTFDKQKYKDYICILSVLAQIAIDSAKRLFDVDVASEIRRIKKDMDVSIRNNFLINRKPK